MRISIDGKRCEKGLTAMAHGYGIPTSVSQGIVLPFVFARGLF